MDAKATFNEDERALRDFLLDIGCLDPLMQWTGKLNLFDILKIARTEIRHSNTLAWLLNPNENHGLGDRILQGFIRYVVTEFDTELDVLETLMMDCYDFLIQREWKHIDILALSTEKKFLICIENKIDSAEHTNQLTRYRSVIEETYPDFKKLFVFLTPDGTESTDPEHWCPMSYQDLLTIVESARSKVKLIPDVALLIDNYTEIIRRNIVGDEKLAQICAEIYAKHQRALDLIFEHKPDRASDVAEIFKKWAVKKTEQGEINVVLDKCTKTCTRFLTKTMSEILPDAEEALSGWNTKNYYFYEIINDGGNRYYMQLAVSSQNIPEHLRVMCDRINALHPSKRRKENWKWRTHFSTRRIHVDEELSEEEIFAQLDKFLENIKSFERNLKARLEQA